MNVESIHHHFSYSTTPSLYFLFHLITCVFIFLSQAVLLSPGPWRVREGADAAGISNQQSHCRWTLSCQQGTGSGNGCPARSGLVYVSWSCELDIECHGWSCRLYDTATVQRVVSLQLHNIISYHAIIHSLVKKNCVVCCCCLIKLFSLCSDGVWRFWASLLCSWISPGQA